MLSKRFDEALGAMPIVAILRGLKPEEAIDIGSALIEGGIRIIEVPLNSPAPFDSIERLANRFGEEAVIGAGTVLSVEDVSRLQSCGAQIAVAPNTDQEIIGAALRCSILPLPGIFTPTEAFAAIRAGAKHLKLFPAEIAGPAGLKAMMAVMPEDISVLAVGGVSTDNIGDWSRAGAHGYGIGSSIYRPGDSPEIVRTKTASMIEAVNMLRRGN